MITPEPTHVIYLDPAGDEPFDAIELPAAGHLGVIEEKCGGAYWPLEYFPERHFGGCGAAL